MARHKLPVEMKRRELFGRVDPKTIEFLSSLNAPNMGRAIDIAVRMLNSSKPNQEKNQQDTVAA